MASPNTNLGTGKPLHLLAFPLFSLPAFQPFHFSHSAVSGQKATTLEKWNIIPYQGFYGQVGILE
jgi:hypothetical protein